MATAATSLNPPYSYRDYTLASGDIVASEADLTYDMEMFDNAVRAHENELVVVRTRDAITTTLVLTDDYTVDGASLVVIGSFGGSGGVPEVADSYRVSRVTTRDARLVDFSNASLLDEADLDVATQQNFFLAQESLDAAANSIVPDDLTDPNACWNGAGREACNFAIATGGNSLPTLSQVQGLLTGETPTEIDDVDSVFYVGDGVITEYTFTGVTSTVPADQMFITIDGITQSWNPLDAGDYTVVNTGSNPVITFGEAPPLNSIIAIRTIKGTFLGSFDDDIIDGDSLIDNSVNYTKLTAVAGDSNRFLSIASDGDVTVEDLDHDAISDFDAGVRTNRLSQMAIPTIALDINNQLLNNVSTPVSSGDAANKSYVDNATASFSLNSFTLAAGAGFNGNTWFKPSTTNAVNVILVFDTSASSVDVNIRFSDGDSTLLIYELDAFKQGSVSFMLPAHGEWQHTNTGTLDKVTYQEIT